MPPSPICQELVDIKEWKKAKYLESYGKSIEKLWEFLGQDAELNISLLQRPTSRHFETVSPKRKARGR